MAGTVDRRYQAQREACEAFIASQRHEGWACLATRYDDGGFSGATMDRPALQRLLADIAKIFDKLAKFDMLNQFVTHTGGGVFACPGGIAEGRFIGQRLFEAG